MVFEAYALDDLIFHMESEDLIRRINKEFSKNIWDDKIYYFYFSSGQLGNFKPTGKFKSKSVKLYERMLNHLGKKYFRIDDDPDDVTFIVET